MRFVVTDPRSFETSEEFENWLSENHSSSSFLWLRIYKKRSGVKSIDYDQALESALCWGWIDGVRKSFDELSFVQRFTPRRRGSNWSRVNVLKVTKLLAEGKIQPPGQAQVDLAKGDGRWTANCPELV